MKRKAAMFIYMMIAILIASCSMKTERYSTVFSSVFDTTTQIIAYAENKDRFDKLAGFVREQLEEYHRLYDIYNDYDGMNNLKTINEQAGLSAVNVDQRIIDLIEFSQEQYALSDGKMNIAYGAVTSIWHEYRESAEKSPESARLPSYERLAAAAVHTDISNVIIDRAASTVFLCDRNMRLDVGAVAKGYAMEQVALMTERMGYTSFLINIGGDVRTSGGKGNNTTPWIVGIQGPEADGKLLKNLEIIDASVATSGDYRRSFMVDGKQYHHIIDPATMYPAEYHSSVTVIHKDSGIADALSTTLFNMSQEQGEMLIRQLDAEAIWVEKNPLQL